MLVALVACHGVAEERFPPTTLAGSVLVSIMIGVVIIHLVLVLVIGVGREEVHERLDWATGVSPRDDCDTARGQAGLQLGIKRVKLGFEARTRRRTAHWTWMVVKQAQ